MQLVHMTDNEVAHLHACMHMAAGVQPTASLYRQVTPAQNALHECTCMELRTRMASFMKCGAVNFVLFNFGIHQCTLCTVHAIHSATRHLKLCNHLDKEKQ